MTKKTKKIPVRIALAVGPDGSYNAVGHSMTQQTSKSKPKVVPAPDEDLMMAAVEHVPDGEARYWVSVEVAVPEEQEVKGEVEKVTSPSSG